MSNRQLIRVAAGASIALVLGALACSSNTKGGNGTGSTTTIGSDSGTGDVSGDDSTTASETGTGFTADVATSEVDGSCAASTFTAMQAPASLLFVLSAANSMSSGGKWPSAANAIVTAIDQDSFNSLSLGLLAAPSGTVTGPSCAFGLAVACQLPTFAQVPLNGAGTLKSKDGTGVRHDIYSWLAGHSPISDPTNGAPVYDALNLAFGAVRADTTTKRIVVLIMDNFSDCASLAGRAAYSDGFCPDWEKPDNIIGLIKRAHDATDKPTLTFVVGPPGSGAAPDSSGMTAPPYYGGRALTAYAHAGAPEYEPAGCDGVWDQTKGNPTAPCHFDMTAGFDSKSLATNISKMRGAALGCTYALPVPKDGSTVDKNKVNVGINSTGSGSIDLSKRGTPSDTCATGDGCWDYDSSGQIVLIGAACEKAKALTDGSVQINVGCSTRIK